MPRSSQASRQPFTVLAGLSLVAAQLAPAPALLAPVGIAGASAQSRSTNVSCYSEPGRTRTCRIPAETADVRYVGNDGACVEGRTWRWSRTELQVRDGCGGNFRISYGGGSGGGSSGGGWGGSGGSWGGSGGGWGGYGYQGEIRCKSSNNRYQRCPVRTEGRVTLVRQHSNSSCNQGRSWGYDNSGIWVDNGCEATFAYGRGNYNPGTGGSGGGWGGGGGSWNSGYRGEVRCASRDKRYQRCSVNTEGRVVLVEQLSRSECRQGRTWGYDNSGIWVNNGCEARFAYGRGNYQPQYGDSGSSGGGSNAGAVVGGVALAAGLIALLSAAGRSSSPSTTSAATTATVDADFGLFPRDAEAAGRACMAEAARQVGTTGGNRVRLDRVDSTQRSAAGWDLLAKVTLSYPQQSRQVTMDCRTNGATVTAFDVR